MDRDGEISMSSKEFWQAVYIAAIARGMSALQAQEVANLAAQHYDYEWSDYDG